MKIVNPSKEMNEVIKLNDYIIGDEYANVFATAFKKANQKIIHLNMRNNKLTNQGAIDIINNLTDHIVSIDFSLNKEMGPPAYELLGHQTNINFFRLKKLSLDHCNISKRSLQGLCDGLVYSTSLTVLNLNHSNLGNEHAVIIADMLQDSTLRMLYIAWNKIRDKGATALFNSLATNHYLQIFDGSFNSFSSTSSYNYGNLSKMSDIHEELEESDNDILNS
jgi:Ran GTPase-activating protein (RanGAP) involved in mRNA processing and transport